MLEIFRMIVIGQRSVTSLSSMNIYSLRRRIAERLSNKFDKNRVYTIGPDLACLEWLMECGATEVEMSDKQKIGSIRQMRRYILETIDKSNDDIEVQMPTRDLAYEEKWRNMPRVYIIKVDASDSAISNEGFLYFRDLRRLETLKLNFCDYFGDEGLRELAMGRPAQTLKDIEIVLNPCMTDGAVYWLSRLKALRRAHFYFLPYVAHRQAFIRQIKLAVPRCNVTFPEVADVGYGYSDKKN